mmetsp:Transcript_14823/g.34318  ORF Transcript_14823/g.34318 Transcript_14823/m.34318 type:complete len:212 (+) Transcript_14823:361-996(+)
MPLSWSTPPERKQRSRDDGVCGPRTWMRRLPTTNSLRDCPSVYPFESLCCVCVYRYCIVPVNSIRFNSIRFDSIQFNSIPFGAPGRPEAKVLQCLLPDLHRHAARRVEAVDDPQRPHAVYVGLVVVEETHFVVVNPGDPVQARKVLLFVRRANLDVVEAGGNGGPVVHHQPVHAEGGKAGLVGARGHGRLDGGIRCWCGCGCCCCWEFWDP